MEGIFLGGSLIAAFFAGAVALFAPCCIVFIFPAYLSAAVRNGRWRLLPLTFIFALGLAVVLVPVTLGVGFLTRSLLRYHGAVYVGAGLILLGLAGAAAIGRSWALPMLKGSPDIQRTDSAGVFALGVFSGAASSCCAPVLAGVVTLSAVAPSMWQGVGIGLAYVFGMVFPLLIMTVAWDRWRIGERNFMRGRTVTWSVLGKTFVTNTLNLITSAVMGTMGLLLVYVGVSGTTIAPTFQSGMATWIEDRLGPVVNVLAVIPDWAAGLFLVAVAGIAIAIAGRRRSPTTDDEELG
ncbi:MAG TPA: cytochrome c biogenesis protein CcdA, partial [Actinobacteria bacterium]|nr:cytochrome c biogenesis protein CcdA [Actinomycetota bacterium]